MKFLQFPNRIPASTSAVFFKNFMVQEDRQRLQRWLVGRAEQGAPNGKELLEMTPCDLFTYLRGRTLWLVGDSMTQAGTPSC